jgi:hypothetical protein
MIVRAADGRPIVGAQVELSTTINPHNQPGPISRQQTDREGAAKFAAIREWRRQTPFVMHGVYVPTWTWCVVKPGYETAHLPNRSQNFEAQAEVVLKAGRSTPCVSRSEMLSLRP